MAQVGKVDEVDYAIKPENVTPAIPTSEWPLLLKNYDKRELPEHGAAPGTRQLTSCGSTRENWAFHTHPMWMHAVETRPQILHLLRRHQLGQALQPLQSRGGGMGQANAPR